MMANDVTISGGNSVSTETVTLVGLQKVVQRLYEAIEKDGYHDVLPSLPPPQLRGRMRERQLELNSVLRPISMASEEQKRARDAVMALLGGYLNVKVDNPAATAAGYTAHLADQPLFAIRQACDDFKHRRVYDWIDGKQVLFTIDHAPSAFRLLDQVKKCAADMREEHHRIGKVLAITRVSHIRNVDPEEQARVAAGLRELAVNFGLKTVDEDRAMRDKIRQEAQEARDRAAKITQEGARRRIAMNAPTVPDDRFYTDTVRS